MIARLRSFIASLNLDALHDPIVSPDLKTIAEVWRGEFAMDEEFFNAMRLASWRRRFVSNDADDLSRTAVTRAQSEPVTAAIPMRRAR